MKKLIFSIIRNTLAVIGVIFIGIIIFVKVSHREQWNHDTGPDLIQEFTTAYIQNVDGTVKRVTVKSWRDFDNSEQLQVTDTNDITYLSSSCRIILTTEK